MNALNLIPRNAPEARPLKARPPETLRFRTLVGRNDWHTLPAAVQARFSHYMRGGEASVYTGHIINTRINVWGKVLANALRLIGGPLPLNTDNGGTAATVSITEDIDGGGQIWTRQYGRKRGFPQTLHSSKRFAGPTGLEEWVTKNIGMTLKVTVEDGALIFKSERYFVALKGQRFYLPRFLTPGTLRVGHTDKGEGRFEFSLKIHHRLFGTLIDQRILFKDMMEA